LMHPSAVEDAVRLSGRRTVRARGICITSLLYRQKKLEINQQNTSVNGIVMIIGHHVGTTFFNDLLKLLMIDMIAGLEEIAKLITLKDLACEEANKYLADACLKDLRAEEGVVEERAAVVKASGRKEEGMWTWQNGLVRLDGRRSKWVGSGQVV
ncbi:hypothetical protein Tco_1428161, partial [Tanacetum coccineum]